MHQEHVNPNMDQDGKPNKVTVTKTTSDKNHVEKVKNGHPDIKRSDTEVELPVENSLGHVIFFFFSNFNIVGYFFGAFLCVEQMLENTFSSKMPFSHPNFTFKFTKGSAQKYKGK